MRWYSKSLTIIFALGLTQAIAQTLGSPGAGGGAPTGAAGGSLGGTYPNPTVVTNANLTGDVTSVGNATTLAAGSASNLNSGTVAATRGGAGTINGALKGNGAGVVSQAACADLSNAGTACSSSIMQTHIITSTRVLSAANGNVAYIGMGFQPTACNGFGFVADGPNQVTLNAMSDAAHTSFALFSYGAAATFTVSSGNFFIFADATAANISTASIVSYDADGLTLAWTKTIGSPTGTANLFIRCQR